VGQELLGIFENAPFEPGPFKVAFRELKRWLLSGTRSFSWFLAMSLILHVFLFGFMIIFNSSFSRPQDEPAAIQVGPILDALSELRTRRINRSSGQTNFSTADEAQIIEILTQAPLFGPGFSEREQTELTQKLVDSYVEAMNENRLVGAPSRITLRDLLSLLPEESDMSLSSGGKAYSPGRFTAPEAPLFYKIEGRSESRLRHLRRLEKYEKQGTPTLAASVTVSNESGKKDVPEEYYFRDCPYGEMLARGAGLFYAVEGFPSLAPKPYSGVKRKVEGDAGFPPRVLQGGIAVYIISASETALPQEPVPAETRPVLNISEEEMQARLDALMAVPEDVQLAHFVKNYLEKYDPHDEGLARFTREFIYQNLSSAFVVTDSFSAAFDFLEELFYDKELLGYLVSYWRENPRTRTGAEFLLALASLYDFERRAISYLFDSSEVAQKILLDKDRFKRAFNQKAKAFVLRRIYEELARAMATRGLESENDLLQLYRSEQIKVYQILMDMGGEERDRALFSLGRVYWGEGLFETARQTWAAISGTLTLESYREMRRVLDAAGSKALVPAGNEALIRNIDRVFEREDSQNVGRLWKRLIKYHKWQKRK
jgi:hypothetical protein